MTRQSAADVWQRLAAELAERRPAVPESAAWRAEAAEVLRRPGVPGARFSQRAERRGHPGRMSRPG